MADKVRLTVMLEPQIRGWVDLMATRRRQTLSVVITTLIEQEQARLTADDEGEAKAG